MSTQPKKKAEYTDILGAHLREDKRIWSDPAAQKKIYSDAMYSFHLLVYSGMPGDRQFQESVLTGIVVYKEESIRIQFKIQSAQMSGTPEELLASADEQLKAEGKTPLHFVRDAKTWCNMPLTERDVSTLLAAGVDVH